MEKLHHITGLRAFAVMIVLFFHLGSPGFNGGFVGVDVFFVISGFLITSILSTELQRTGKVDLSRFFSRRMRRLFPALFVTLVATFIVAAFVLSPEHLQRLGYATITAALSVSNILFWQEIGYFDVLQEFKPLLHTWSLSVEMQFYLVWPLIMLLACRISARILPVTLFSLAAGSFVANYGAAGDAIFFLTPFRVFEFAIGASLVWVHSNSQRNDRLANTGTIAGLALIAGAVLWYEGGEAYPRHLAIVPCIGAALVIFYGRSPVGKILLTNRPAVLIGEISYSIYLVHWPLITLYRYWIFGEQLSIGQQFWIAIITFVLAAGLYRLVERPFIERSPHQPWRVWVGVVASMILLVVPVAHATTDGWAWRSVYPSDLREEQRDLFERVGAFGCRIEREILGECDFSKQHVMLVVGDSHLPAWAYGLSEALPDTQVVMLSYLGCHEAISISTNRVVGLPGNAGCDAKASFLNSDDPLFQRISGIVLASYRPFSYHVNSFRFDLIDFLKHKSPSARTFILGNYFQTDPQKPCNAIIQRRRDAGACLLPEFVSYVGNLEQVRSEPLFHLASKYIFVDVTTLVCPALTECPAQHNGIPALADSDHMNLGFVKFIAEKLISNNFAYLRSIGFIN